MLSRLLYPIDEVYTSFVTELLVRNNIDKCFFWISELYYSKEKVIEFMWKIYFDFYAEINPKLDSYIKKKTLSYTKTESLQDVFDIVENLFICKSTSTVFLLRQYEIMINKPLITYKKTNKAKWEWLKEYSSEYSTLLKALHKNNLICSATELRNIMKKKTSHDIYNTIVSYFSKHIVLVSSDAIEKKWKSTIWYDDYHGLLALIAHLSADPQDIKRQHVFKKTTNACVAEYILCNKDIESRHTKKDRVYSILSHHRRYKLHHGAKVFNIKKIIMSIDLKQITENWIFYAYDCKLWKMRIKEWGGRLNNKQKMVDFNCDEKKSEFYDRYYLEVDEQPKDIQNMSDDTRYIEGVNKIFWQTWHSKIFDNDPIIHFPNTFRFTY